MRVIAGKARRTLLNTPAGLVTRPTIEALSRGCKSAVFVEQDRKALFCIKANLKRTGLSAGARLFAAEVFAALASLRAGGESFDIIFMDPPYRLGFAKRVLSELAGSVVCTPETLVIFEEAIEEDIAFVKECGFALVKEKRYKTNKHVFVRKNS